MLPTTIPWERMGGGTGAPLVLTGVRVGLDILYDLSRNGIEKNLLRVAEIIWPGILWGEALEDVID